MKTGQNSVGFTNVQLRFGEVAAKTDLLHVIWALCCLVMCFPFICIRSWTKQTQMELFHISLKAVRFYIFCLVGWLKVGTWLQMNLFASFRRQKAFAVVPDGCFAMRSWVCLLCRTSKTSNRLIPSKPSEDRRVNIICLWLRCPTVSHLIV